ncbi:unnamed protein product [Brugia timori]|uniref:Headcase domain-containing protein n=1 Tax=Brugia timori TaxID=42155 RepID=A0A0R3QYH8_9BILA|nr:unnamed protein product [Brugia timori]
MVGVGADSQISTDLNFAPYVPYPCGRHANQSIVDSCLLVFFLLAREGHRGFPPLLAQCQWCGKLADGQMFIFVASLSRGCQC